MNYGVKFTKTIYSIDEQLSKVREVTVINPFPKEQLHKYQKYIEDRLKGTNTWPSQL